MDGVNHAGRAHSLCSASNAHIWLECPPSARLGEQFPDTASNSAAEGTLAHELAELKLRNYFHTVDFGKQKLTRAVNKLKKGALWQDEMQGYTDDYLDYVKSVAMGFEGTPYVAIEKKVDLGAFIPEGFGTCDCILIGGGEIHVIDFKYGEGVPVAADHNPQLMLYALGAYEAYKLLYAVTRVTVHIVQPRLADGISSWSCGIGELLEFGRYAKGRAELAFKGEGEFNPGKETCRFCRAKARCHARAEYNVKLAFAVGKKPPLITNGEMGEYLRQGAGVAKWLSELQELALKECLAGREVPGWKAVEGRSLREWSDMDAAFAQLQLNGIPDTILYERKPLTLAQVEKTVGKEEFADYVGMYVIKKPGKPALVPEADRRQAITNKITAAEAFKEENNYEQ